MRGAVPCPCINTRARQTPDKRRFSMDLRGQITTLEQEVKDGQEGLAMRHTSSKVCQSLGNLALR